LPVSLDVRDPVSGKPKGIAAFVGNACPKYTSPK